MRKPDVLLSRTILAVTGVIACVPAPEEELADPRTAVPVSAEVGAAVRAEMRTMLESLHSILTALPAGDTAALRRAALASGLAAAADPQLEEVLPEEFLRLGTATHRQFDSLGAAVAAGIPLDSVVARLGRLTRNCVSCHESYRLTVGRGAAATR